MNDLNEVALDYAITNAVEFLEEAGTTDLSTLSADDVRELMRVIICRYLDANALS